MSKALTELIRDANREIHPWDRHAILDLIEQQAARIAALESAEKENGELLTALAECRDAFPVPAVGGELEGHWLSAVANPDEVPAYVKACIEAAEKEAAGQKSSDGRTIDRSMVKRLAIQHGLIPDAALASKDAIRREAFEDAAKVCDDAAAKLKGPSETASGYAALVITAHEIRALSQRQAQER